MIIVDNELKADEVLQQFLEVEQPQKPRRAPDNSSGDSPGDVERSGSDAAGFVRHLSTLNAANMPQGSTQQREEPINGAQ